VKSTDRTIGSRVGQDKNSHGLNCGYSANFYFPFFLPFLTFFSFLFKTFSINFFNFFFSPPSGFSSFSFLSAVFLDFCFDFFLSFFFSFFFFFPCLISSFPSLLLEASLTSFLASAGFACFLSLFSVDEDIGSFFSLGVSLVALSFFVAEATFGLLALAGLAIAVLLAVVAVGFAALSVFGVAVFVAEVAF